MNPFTWLWIAIGVQAAALETYALVTDSRRTLSQTLRREFAHAPWVTAIAFGAFVGWFLLHIWGPLLVKTAGAAVNKLRAPRT